jgi:hypothetical protein
MTRAKAETWSVAYLKRAATKQNLRFGQYAVLNPTEN